ncbi:putative uncharacterized protein DDB_G0282133 isoform X2 [Athalia rosae]|nr:putative uncharacterized protein DDB_G0282133 isoform X2 [Athalia rosae]
MPDERSPREPAESKVPAVIEEIDTNVDDSICTRALLRKIELLEQKTVNETGKVQISNIPSQNIDSIDMANKVLCPKSKNEQENQSSKDSDISGRTTIADNPHHRKKPLSSALLKHTTTKSKLMQTEVRFTRASSRRAFLRSYIANQLSFSDTQTEISEKLTQNSNKLSSENENHIKENIEITEIVPDSPQSTKPSLLKPHVKSVKNEQNKIFLASETNDDIILKNKAVDVHSASENYSRNPIILSRSRFCKRKSTLPVERTDIQTRLSRSLQSLDIKKYIHTSQSATFARNDQFTTGKNFPQKLKKEEECNIICTPDININNFFIDEIPSNDHKTASPPGKENRGELRSTRNLRSRNPHKSSAINTISSHRKTRSATKAASKSSPKSVRHDLTKTHCRPEPKLRRINMLSMPVHHTKMASPKDEDKDKMQGTDKKLPSWMGRDSDETNDSHCKRAQNENNSAQLATAKETQTFFNSLSLCSRSNESSNPKVLYVGHTDSEETLSNVESVPNSPIFQLESWTEKVKKNLQSNNKGGKSSLGADISSKRSTNAIGCAIPVNVSTDSIKNHTDEKSKSVNSKHNMVIDCQQKKSELQHNDGVRVDTIPLSSNKGTQNDLVNVDNDEDSENLKAMPWLKYYEKSRANHKERIENTLSKTSHTEVAAKKNEHLCNTLIKDTQAIKKAPADTANISKSSVLKHQKYKYPTPVKPSSRKRGRPSKQDLQNSKLNSGQTVKKNHSKLNQGSTLNADSRSQWYNSDNPPEKKKALSGSALSTSELEQLFLKFLEHGHFRNDPGQPLFVTHEKNFYNNAISRLYCYDTKKDYMQPYYNVNADNNIKSYVPSESRNQFPSHTNNSNSAKSGRKLRTINPNSYQNITYKNGGQSTRFENIDSCCPPTDTDYTISDPLGRHSNESSRFATDHRNYNSELSAHITSASNMQQSGYITAPDYYQNCDNNDKNLMKNDFYLHNNFFVNSNNCISDINNDTKTTGQSNSEHFSNYFNSAPNSVFQQQSPQPRREVDFSMNNENSLPGNNTYSLLHNTSVNDPNFEWNLNNMNHPLEPVNELQTNSNSTNYLNEPSYALGKNSDMNSFLHDTNSTVDYPNPWINTTNSSITHGYPTSLPWHGSLPTYNSYSGNKNRCYNNPWNPYIGLVGYDASNSPHSNTNAKHNVENNKTSSTQDMFSTTDGNYSLNAIYSEQPGINFVPLQKNNPNEGINVTLDNNTTANTMNPKPCSANLNDSNTSTGQSRGSDSVIESLCNNVNAPVFLNTNNNTPARTVSCVDQTAIYSSPFTNDMNRLDFNDPEKGNFNKNNGNEQQNQNALYIKDYTVERIASFEDCFQRKYGHPVRSQTCEQPPYVKETDISKLRQELADFTRQYSDGQISPISQMLQDNEIFICLSQILDTESNSP